VQNWIVMRGSRGSAAVCVGSAMRIKWQGVMNRWYVWSLPLTSVVEEELALMTAKIGNMRCVIWQPAIQTHPFNRSLCGLTPLVSRSLPISISQGRCCCTRHSWHNAHHKLNPVHSPILVSAISAKSLSIQRKSF
jgi:hypothetical protein